MAEEQPKIVHAPVTGPIVAQAQTIYSVDCPHCAQAVQVLLTAQAHLVSIAELKKAERD